MVKQETKWLGKTETSVFKVLLHTTEHVYEKHNWKYSDHQLTGIFFGTLVNHLNEYVVFLVFAKFVSCMRQLYEVGAKPSFFSLRLCFSSSAQSFQEFAGLLQEVEDNRMMLVGLSTSSTVSYLTLIRYQKPH